MKLKVCGMKYVENIKQVAALQPDYLGFIFYEKSKRNFEGIIPEIPKNIKKVGVFVNEYPEIVVSLAQEYQLQALQLHGDESVTYIQKLKEAYNQAQLDFAAQHKKPKQVQDTIKIIKVFGIKDEFNFDILKAYEEVVDYFLFDTKGKERGGNGVTFNWEVLKGYNSTKPYFLSGGIGLQEVKEVQSFLQTPAAAYCMALDINSKFESAPGKKEIDRLKKFKKQLIAG